MFIEYNKLIFILGLTLIAVIPITILVHEKLASLKVSNIFFRLLYLIIGSICFVTVIIFFNIKKIIEVKVDSSKNLYHREMALIGNKTFFIKKNIFDTSKLPEFSSLVINYSDRNLVITNILFSNNKKDKLPNNFEFIDKYNYKTLKYDISYFFHYNPPPESIRVKGGSSKILYWLIEN